MNGGFYIGAIGLDAQQRALDVVANNIANLNTNGFKRSGVQFSELVSPARANGSVAEPVLDRIAGLQGATVSATPRVWTEGALRQTGQALDVAIDGAGFLEALGPGGKSLLWRGGTLKVNEDGFLANSDGLPLRAMIAVPQSATGITISSDGIVSATVSGATQTQRLGQIDIAMVKDPDTLADAGGGYFQATDDSSIVAVQPGDEGSGTLAQGSLEESNVQLTDEMTQLLLVQRAYGANAQVVQAGDQLMSIINGLRR